MTMDWQIYCQPRDLVACWSQKWDCAPEVIEKVFRLDKATPADRADQINLLATGIKEMRARGYKQADYCEGCGHRIMTLHLEQRR